MADIQRHFSAQADLPALAIPVVFPCTLDGHVMSPRREFPAIPQSWTIASVLDADKDKLAWDLVASPVSTTVPSEDGDDEHAPAVLAAKANASVVEAAIVADKGLTPAASIEAASTFDDSADEQLELRGDLGKRDKNFAETLRDGMMSGTIDPRSGSSAPMLSPSKLFSTGPS